MPDFRFYDRTGTGSPLFGNDPGKRRLIACRSHSGGFRCEERLAGQSGIQARHNAAPLADSRVPASRISCFIPIGTVFAGRSCNNGLQWQIASSH